MDRGERGGVERKSSSGIGAGGNTTQGAKLPGPRQKIKLWLQPLGCGGRELPFATDDHARVCEWASSSFMFLEPILSNAAGADEGNQEAVAAAARQLKSFLSADRVNGQVLEPSFIFVQPILGKRIEVYKLPEPLLRRSSLQGLTAERNKTYIRYYFGTATAPLLPCVHTFFFFVLNRFSAK